MLAAVRRAAPGRYGQSVGHTITTRYVLYRSSSTATTTSSSSVKPGPLVGVRVLDLSRILAGPYCTQILGDMGAEIWKVEHPVGGDDTRFWGPPFVKPKETPVIASPHATANAYVSVGESAYFMAANRNKQSVAIDLKSAAGQAIVRDLARQADVLVENWMPGKLAEFGLDYESLKAVNPSLIYASLTGFGPTGPLSDRPGYDVMAAARGGLMHITGSPSEPSKVGVAITDLSSGLVLHGAILAALFARERDPQRRGQHVETNLLEVQVASLANIGQNYHCDPKRVGRRVAHSAHESIVPYQAFKAGLDVKPAAADDSPVAASADTTSQHASTGEYFICGALNNRQFRNLLAAVEEMTHDLALSGSAIDISSLRDEKYASNPGRVRHRDELIPLLQSVFSRFPKSRLLDVLVRHDIPSSPINNLEQVFADEQVRASGIVQRVQHPLIGEVTLTGSPAHFSETPTRITAPPPMLGQHTQDVLRRVLGTTDDEIKRLERDGTIGSYEPIR